MNLFRRKFVILRVTNFSYKEKLVTNNQFGQEYMNAGDIAGYHRISVVMTAAAAVSAILYSNPSSRRFRRVSPAAVALYAPAISSR